MRSVKDIAEDLVNSGLNRQQARLLDELLEAVTAEKQTPDTVQNAQPEGDDVADTTTD